MVILASFFRWIFSKHRQMKFFKSHLNYILLLCLILISCEKDEVPKEEIVKNAVEVISVEVTAETQNLLKGTTAQLSVLILPSNATNKTVTWDSNDALIATVSSNGLLAAVGVGEVTITAKSSGSKEVLGTIILQITEASATNEILSFKIKGGEALKEGNKLTFEFLEGTKINSITPLIIHNGATILPTDTAPQDFNNTVIYTVTAANGETQEWQVIVVLKQIESTGPAFVTTWKTDNTGASEDNQITIPTFDGEVYNYNVNWGDGKTDDGISGNITHTYDEIGTYEVSITGDFPRIYFKNPYNLESGDDDKLISIDQWGTNAWTSMEYAFAGCENVQIETADIPNLSNVISLAYMFSGCTLMVGNYTFDAWNTSSISILNNIFRYADAFNAPIGNWDVSNIIGMSSIFSGARSFNQDLGNWDLSNAVTTESMFAYATSFNQNIAEWDVSNVQSSSSMFSGAESFNQDIGNWDVSNIKRMGGMFSYATSFNRDISSWDIHNVTKMHSMFQEATAFNQDISNWNTSNVDNMSRMFLDAQSFNQNIGNWNVGNVLQMGTMFSGATSFNQNISEWDVSNATWMYEMFKGATSFNQNLGKWDVSNVTKMEEMFLDAGLSRENYDTTLIGWNSLPTLSANIEFHGGASVYCEGETARQNLINTYGWIITDGGKDCN